MSGYYNTACVCEIFKHKRCVAKQHICLCSYSIKKYTVDASTKTCIAEKHECLCSYDLKICISDKHDCVCVRIYMSTQSSCRSRQHSCICDKPMYDDDQIECKSDKHICNCAIDVDRPCKSTEHKLV